MFVFPLIDPNQVYMQVMVKDSFTSTPAPVVKRPTRQHQSHTGFSRGTQRQPKQTQNKKPDFMQLVIQDPYQEVRNWNNNQIRRQHVKTEHDHQRLQGGQGESQKTHGAQGNDDVFFSDLKESDFPVVERHFRKVNKQFKNGDQFKRRNRKRLKIQRQNGKQFQTAFPNFPEAQKHLEQFNQFSESHNSLEIPSRRLKPPAVNAPVAHYGHNRGDHKFVQLSQQDQLKLKFQRSKAKVRKSLQRGHLPETHPLRNILPDSARIVGIRPLRPLALSNRSKNPKILTLSNFLSNFPDMNQIRAIPVPVEGKDVSMIESLVHNSSISNRQREHLLAELDELIAERSARRVNGNGKFKLQPLTVRPRGGGAGPRFHGTTAESSSGESSFNDNQFPALEFGFTPVVSTTPRSLFSPTPIWQTQISGTTAAPTLLSTLADVDQQQKEAFFFTTTEAPKTLEEADRTSRKSTLGFDMRNLFYIPPEKKKKKNHRPSIFSP